jgi:ribosomal protein S18 acetylase RimI-like enzyme
MTVVRTGSLDDLDAAIGVWESANSGSGLDGHQQRLRQWARLPGSTLHLAVGDPPGAVLGMVLSMTGRAYDGAGPPIAGLHHLAGLAVLPARQRAGVGRALLEHAVAHARSLRAERVTLWARRGNAAAEHLLGSVGFTTTGRTQPDATGAIMDHFELVLGA